MSLSASRSAAGLSRQALRKCRNSPGRIEGGGGAVAETATIAPIITRRPNTAAAAFFSTSPPRRNAVPTDEDSRPRWSYTPERMKAPFSPHITRDPTRRVWHVNNDPKKLDAALVKFFGRDGDRLLPDELKWLAVTHKSFDQGRRGFNDRLAFLGRQICVMEATQLIITSSADFAEPPKDVFAARRQPFQDNELRSLDNLTTNQPNNMFSPEKLLKVANETGLTDVVRWKPKQVRFFCHCSAIVSHLLLTP